MNSSQKEVQQTHLDEEKKVIRQLKQVYKKAIEDCQKKISELNARTDMQNLQSIIYQTQYQEALESQLSAILINLQANEYQNISDYLTGSYTNGYVGTMYDIQKQTGCTILTPINQEQVVAALQTDSKLSKSLYSRLGEDVTYLKKSIKAELSRGIANGSTWLEMAEHIAAGMNTPYKKALNNAIRIARTEGHRIQQQSALDAMKTAVDEGADVVKQWDATLDSRTRPDHRAADGQIRELDDKFKVGGESLEAPGIGGSARNVVNCRCCLLQRAKWALDEDELNTLKARAAYYGLDKTADFEEFRTKYLKAGSLSTQTHWSDMPTGKMFATKKEAFQYFKDNGITVSDSKKYPMDEKVAVEMAQWHNKFTNNFLEFTQNIKYKLTSVKNVAPSRMRGGTLGEFRYYVSGTVEDIRLNSGLYNSYDNAAKKSEHSASIGWHSGGNAMHTWIHEYGHYVSHSLEKMGVSEHDIVSSAVNEYKKNHPEYTYTSYVGLKDALSKYGTTNESECFAEAFSEYFGEENPREFATIFGHLVENAMKGIKTS